MKPSEEASAASIEYSIASMKVSMEDITEAMEASMRASVEA